MNPVHWKKRSRVPPETRVPLRIGLKQRNLHLGSQHLDDVSNPNSQNYGKHWTPEKIAKAFSPAEESIESVNLWLREAGIDIARYSLSASRHWINIDATVEEVEDLLHTEYHVFEHALTSESHIGCSEYSVPGSLRDHIDLITPTLGLMPNGNKLRKREVKGASNHHERRNETVSWNETVSLNATASLTATDLGKVNCNKETTPDCVKGATPSLQRKLNC